MIKFLPPTIRNAPKTVLPTQRSGNSRPVHSAWPSFYKVKQTHATSATWPGADVPSGAGCTLLFEKHHAEEEGTEGGHTVCQNTALGRIALPSGFFVFVFVFVYFWLRWVFIAVCGLSLVAVSGGYSSLWCVGFSLRWLLLLRSTGCRHTGFSSCSTRAQ